MQIHISTTEIPLVSVLEQTACTVLNRVQTGTKRYCQGTKDAKEPGLSQHFGLEW